MQQTPLSLSPSDHEHSDLMMRFEDLKLLHTELGGYLESFRKITKAPVGTRALHKSGRIFNRYRSVTGPPGTFNGEVVQAARPRYSPRHRIRRVRHEPPPIMKKYVRKPYKPKPIPQDKATTSKASRTSAKKRKTEPVPVEELEKWQLIRMMDHEHPIVVLTVGTVQGNATRAQVDTAEETVQVIQEITTIASEVIVKAQCVIGRFVEYVSSDPQLSPKDLDLMNAICPPFGSADDSDDSDDEGATDQQDRSSPKSQKFDASRTHQRMFLELLLRHLYSGKALGSTERGELVQHLLQRCPVLPPNRKTYSGAALLESTASKLASELRGHFKSNTRMLSKKVGVVVRSYSSHDHTHYMYMYMY